MRAEEAIKKYHESCKVCFLATCEGDRPRLRPMSPLAVDGRVVWMATWAASEKMAQLAANPNVELCYMDADHNHLRLRGTVEVCDDAETKRRLWEGYPLLARFFQSPKDPQYVLLKFTAAQAMVMQSMSREYQTLQVQA